jgi:hypothetical protein
MLTNGPIVHPSGEPQWKDIDRGKLKNPEKETCPSVIYLANYYTQKIHTNLSEFAIHMN